MSLLKCFDQAERSWSVNYVPQANVGLGLTENEEESEDQREGREAQVFQSPCILNFNPFIPRSNSQDRNEAKNHDSGLQNKESQVGNMPTNNIKKKKAQAPPTPKSIEVPCQNQENQAAIDNAPCMAQGSLQRS